MKFVLRKYNVKSNKIRKSVRIVGITDLHYTFYSKNIKLEAIINEIIKSNANYVCFTGDLVDHTSRINAKSLEELYNFFKKLSSFCKVIFIKGNHDTFDDINEYYNLTDFFDRLDKLKDFYYLDGKRRKCVEFEDVTFYGFELYNDFYYEFIEKNDDLLLKKCNMVLKGIDKEKFNVLLFHSPILLLKDEFFEKCELLKNVDLILCGHMHNGLVPNFLDNKKSNHGLLSPRKKLFPPLSRNRINKGSTTAIIMYPLSFYYKVEKYNFEFLFKPGYQIIDIEK